MYKILIVDDEAIERRCISFILENSKYSLEIEEAENGQKAYERLQEKEFDILFSDVKMPFMDGLELAEKAVHLYSDIRVVIFSGFSEFEYARTAIRIGCVNYILKPVNPEALLTMICEVLKRLDEEREKKAIACKKSKYVQEHCLLKLLNSVCMTEDEMNFLQEEQVKYNRLIFIEFEHDFFDSDYIDFANQMKEVINIDFSCVNIAANQAVLFMKKSGFSVDYGVAAKRLQEGIWKNYREKVYIAVGDEFKELNEIGNAYSELEKRMEERFFFPDLTIFTEESLKYAHSNVTKSKEEIFKALSNEIAGKDEEGLKKHWIMLNESISRLGCSQIYIKHMLSSTALELYDALVEKTAYPVSADEFIESIYMSTDIEEILSKVYELVEIVCKEWRKGSCVHNRVIKDVIQYIYEHYTDSISLDILSENVNMDSSYLSRLFKKEMGINISCFIKNIRMEKAKYLLENTNEKVNNISMMVGYNKLSYFCRSFREYYGISPEKHRTNGGTIDA